MSHAINVIKQEHRNYLALLTCLDGLLRGIEAKGAEPDFELLHAILDYTDSFLYRFHHPKEDNYLFVALRRRHAKAAELLDELERQHRKGCELLAAMRTALEEYEEKGAPGLDRFRSLAQRYQELEYRHMRQEELEVLPLALAHLSEADWAEIDAAFDSHDDPLFGDVPRARFRKLFSKIVEMAPEPYGFGARMKSKTG